jgi:hypothetical protein
MSTSADDGSLDAWRKKYMTFELVTPTYIYMERVYLGDLVFFYVVDYRTHPIFTFHARTYIPVESVVDPVTRIASARYLQSVYSCIKRAKWNSFTDRHQVIVTYVGQM